ncbi:adenylate/guanylate cyclase domain-containing protein [Acuticoccus sp. MNP-M23]|uniref:adenylate/guanylate cyclase domain-containing protein n=1 Tax=Acuticoccus sp. MNP-M23 TaxID=3072793 RepID=UPI00281662DE|nr:adenylate/guanylate cyclase domain-containing protein [Acuticoccus sp. MNP-M23]WMS40779.1 adenylate/guanylate cyclase domain-containing protein [Acuticoccus sp. MNP-M23]
MNEAARLSDWLLRDGVNLDLSAMVESLALRLTALGFKIDRFSVGFGLLNPSLLAASILWRPESGIEFTRFGYDNRNSGMYERSPFKVAFETQAPVYINIDKTPDEAFGIVPELRAGGIRHYTVIPLPHSGRDLLLMTLATKDAEDFPAEAHALLAAIVPALSAVVQIRTLQATFRDVLAAYVGKGPARQIIDGTIHRGEVTKMRAAILVADLRGFTHLSTQLPAGVTAEMINRYYDVVVPPITERNGEILKFIGDAVLATFPTEGKGDAAAVLTALDAARAMLDTEVPPFHSEGREFPIRFGVAIHLGDAVFGNVGSGDRLDFTVIGRDVNVAARLASLCSHLGEEYLVSQEVAAIGVSHGRAMQDAGEHPVRGLAQPLRVFVPGPAKHAAAGQEPAPAAELSSIG